MADPITKPGKAKSFAASKSAPPAAATGGAAPTAPQFGVPAEAPVVPLAVPAAATAVVVPTEAAKPTPTPEPIAAAPAAQTEGPKMNETVSNTLNTAQDTMNTAQANMKTAANEGAQRATAMFGDMSDRAKTAMEKGTKAIEEIVEFSKGNMEAVVASGRVVAKGAEEIAKYSAEYGRTALETANANARRFAAVKSPAEFFQLQGEIAKASMDALVQEGSKFTENYMKLMGEVAQPISNRVAIAADKVKSSTSM